MSQISHDFERSWDAEGVRIIDCKTCGFIHMDPIPTKEEIVEFYRSKYFKEVKPFRYEAVNDAFIENKLSQISKNGSYRFIYNKVCQLLPNERTPPLRMLDIGCGNDLLSRFFLDRQWEANVLEPNRDAAGYLRKFGVTVYENFADELEKLGLQKLFFVNIQFVLEHIVDPTDLLRQVHKAMAPGGVIRICVPNDFSVGQLAYQEYYREKYRWVVRPDHINYFSFSSLSGLLRKTGFEEVYRTTNFPLEFLLLGGQNYYTDEEARRRVNPFVTQFQEAFAKTGRWEQLTRLYESLAQLEMGRSVFMFAVKR